MTRSHLAIALAGALIVAPAAARADVVLEWNAIMESAVAAQNPFAQGRFAAITQLAVFEAVNAITGGYTPYLGTVDAPAGASPEAAAVAAAHRVLKTYFPANTSIDSARAASLAAIAAGPAKDAGVAVGEAAAAALIAQRAADGSAPPQFHPPASAEPGEWQRTAGCPAAGGLLLHWRNVTPFVLDSSSQFRSAPPPPLTSRRYARDFAEVKHVGVAGSLVRPPDRAEVARFYAAVLAVATWNQAFRQLGAAQGRSLTHNARALALLNAAISDALVSVMETKYHYTFWRPETAVPAGDVDGNRHTVGDAMFVPYLPTPCFPGYPSAHASASYAAAAIARRLYGEGGHTITVSSAAVPDVTLHYTCIGDITRDIDDARVYAGIHFRFDQRAGAKQGRQIGRYALAQALRRQR